MKSSQGVPVSIICHYATIKARNSSKFWKNIFLVTLLPFLFATPVYSLINKFERRKNNFLSAIASSNVGSDPASRFHTDMIRVLQSRENLLSSNSENSPSPLERRERPALLVSDIDGAERVSNMLQHMVDIGVATEDSYRIVLKALCNRRRLRWRRKDSTIVCAADEVQLLMDELLELQNGHVETETCNMALKAYAVCSTPRGNRDYAQRAQTLIDHMEKLGALNAESLSHVIHAWSWQQENLKPGECAKMAQQNFDKLLELYSDEEEDHVETLLQGHRWLLEAWSKSASKGSAEIAEQLLYNMTELAKSTNNEKFPNSQSYSNVILAWAKEHGTESAEKAQEILAKTLKSYADGQFPEDSEPELIAFNGVLSAWARIGRADKAEEVLWMADKLRSKCKTLVPDAMSYNSVLHAYVRSGDKTKALNRILSIVKHMEDGAQEQPAMKPDSFTYNTVLKVSSGDFGVIFCCLK